MRTIRISGLFLLCMVLIVGFVLPAGALAANVIKIGVIYPLTGGAAAAGRELRAGVELADRGYVLQTGRIVGQGSGKELLGSDMFREAFLGI